VTIEQSWQIVKDSDGILWPAIRFSVAGRDHLYEVWYMGNARAQHVNQQPVDSLATHARHSSLARQLVDLPHPAPETLYQAISLHYAPAP
jgi:hypothetical protein